MIIKTVESSEEESGESDIEWQDGHTTHQLSLQDSLLKEELEISQPLVVNTVPVQDITPNTHNLEREETTMIHKCLSDT